VTNSAGVLKKRVLVTIRIDDRSESCHLSLFVCLFAKKTRRSLSLSLSLCRFSSRFLRFSSFFVYQDSSTRSFYSLLLSFSLLHPRSTRSSLSRASIFYSYSSSLFRLGDPVPNSLLQRYSSLPLVHDLQPRAFNYYVIPRPFLSLLISLPFHSIRISSPASPAHLLSSRVFLRLRPSSISPRPRVALLLNPAESGSISARIFSITHK